MGELISGSKGVLKRKVVLVDEDDTIIEVINFVLVKVHYLYINLLLMFAGVSELDMELDDVSDNVDEFAIQDPYTVVMSKEKNGYRRLYGRGISNQIIKNVNSGEPIESVSKDHLLKIQKSIEDDHEKKKGELKAMHEDQQKQKAELEEMQRNLSKQQEKLIKFFKLLHTVVGREFQ